MPQKTKFHTRLLVIFSLTVLNACSPGETATKDVIKRGLKDPSSAQFQDFRVVQGGKIGCIRVNAKNSYGAYSGYELLAVEAIDSSQPRQMEGNMLDLVDLCSSGPDSDKAYAKMTCVKLVERISRWERSLKELEKTAEEKQQYAKWIEDDSAETKKWCPSSSAPSPSPQTK